VGGSRARAALASALTALTLAASAAAQTPVGAAFTYQGRLTDAGGPVTGNYDLRFTLFDAATAGNPVGSPVTVSAVAVAQGLFSVSLDFGAGAVTGSARWLSIEVRPAGGGSFTLLSPRQRLAPAPQSVFSSFTDPANLTVLNASNLTTGTVPGARLAGTYAQSLTLSNPANALTGTFTGNGLALTALNASSLTTGTVPGAALGGTYPNAVAFTNPANSFTGNGAGLTNLNAQPRYVRTVVVSPVGSATQNGTALLAALAGITGASVANQWLVKIEPGVYAFGAGGMVMKPYVDVEGSGEQATRLTAPGNASNAIGTVNMTDHAELRFLSVESTGGAAYAKAVYVSAGGANKITHVTATAFGASAESQGIFIDGAVPNDTVVRDVSTNVTATGSASAFGLLVIGPGSPLLRNLHLVAFGGTSAQALFIFGGATPLVLDVEAHGLGATALNRGVTSIDASPGLRNVAATASGPSTFSDGIASFGTSGIRLERVKAYAATTIGQATGIYNGPGTTPWLADVYAEAQGGLEAWGMNNDGIGGPPMDQVSAVAFGTLGTTNTAIGIRNVNSSPFFTHLTVIAGNAAEVMGVYNGGTGSVVVSQATIRASSGPGTTVYGVRGLNSSIVVTDALVQASGGTTAYGVGAEGSSSALTRVEARALGAATTNAAVYNATASSVSLRNVVAVALGGNFANGLRNQGLATTITVDGSTLSGSGAAIANLSINNTNASTISVGASKLIGPVANPGAGALLCLFSYNASYGVLPSTCL
jgi:hypothetical protein